MGEHRIPGPLSPYAGGFEGELARLGFTPWSARHQMRLVADLSSWLADAGLDVAGLADAVAGQYAAVRRTAGMKYRTPEAFRPLLGYLRRLGVSPEPAPAVPATPAESLLEEFGAWLLSERGVTHAVARGYRDLVRPFAEQHAAGGLAGLSALTAGDVTAFLTAQSRRLAPKTAQRTATALRSLLRFCHLRGLAPGRLDQAVPTVANRRPGLPRPLEPGQVGAMLDACDPGTAAGRRDLAMLTLMARMGLRAGEVAGLRLDDISWRSGEITVRGKGGRLDRLPLTADAGAGDRCLASRRASRRSAGPGRVHAADGPAAGPDRGRRHHGRGRRGRPGRAGHGARAPAAAQRGDRDPRQRRFPGRDRPGPPAPAAGDHRNLCEGRHRGAAVPRAPVAGSSVVTGMGQALDGYLDLRRGLGFKLARDEKLLRQFIAWAEGRGASTVTAADALAWAVLPGRDASRWQRMRLSVVRGFARYLATLDPDAEIPPSRVLPAGRRRAVPFLYSAADVTALMTQARHLRTRLRPATIATLTGLLAVTGMRIGEAIALDDADFDPARQLLLIRNAKFGRDRLLPLHPSAAAAVQDYRNLRDQAFPRPVSEALLASRTGTRLRHENVSVTFARLARQAGLASRPGGARPRIHDVRHSFAVATLLDWLRDGGSVAERLPLLSAYLGHADPADTYWYYSDSRVIPIPAPLPA